MVIIVPAYNEEKVIEKVLMGLEKVKIREIDKEIVVVNDGSSDKTEKLAKKHNVTVLNHVINRGLGGALGTGIEYAKLKKADIVITFDADGQHSSKDIYRLISPIVSNEADFVIGSRLLGRSTMPADRRILNFAANLLNYLLWSFWITDSQSGLRAISKKALEKIEIRMNKMEVSSEFLKEIKRNRLKVKEIPIKAIYTDYSRSKGQKNTNSLNVLVKLLLYKIGSFR